MRTYGLDFTNMHYCKIIHPWRKNLAAKLERTPISYSCLFYTYSQQTAPHTVGPGLSTTVWYDEEE